ncbi:MAG: patatin-like phospholipase family protein [Candidatus Zixiibacteriota bacterium]
MKPPSLWTFFQAVIIIGLLNTIAPAQTAGEFSLSLSDLSPQTIDHAFSRNLRGFRIGVALSGGGARGFAHIGVLRALEEAGIEIDIVAGTSMGGIIGGLYAAGMAPADIERESLNIEWSTFFSDRPRRTSLLFTRRTETEGALMSVRFDNFNPQIPTALSSGQKLVNVLSDLTQTTSYFSQGNFANLNRRLAIVSTDIVTGKKVVFTSGSLVEALRATMGVPLAFTPFERDGQLLMDGGLLEPVPTETAREIGADFVIAVNTSSELLPKDEIDNPIDIADQTTTILSAKIHAELLAAADYVITPDLTGIKATDFRSNAEAIKRGYETTQSALVELRKLLAAKTAQSAPRYICDLQFGDDRSRELLAADTLLLRELNNASLSDSQVREKLYAFFRSGNFQNLKYTVGDGDSTNLHLTVTPFPQVEKLVVDGNRVYADSTLLRIANLANHPIRNVYDLRRAYDSLITFYRSEGYDLARIKSAWINPTDSGLTIVIDEGQIIGISVEGNVKTRWWVVASYFPQRVGDFYNKIRTIRGVQEIYNSGLYENVNLRLEERSGGVHITIIVKENKFTFARIGARYHEEFHPESFLRVGYANLFGTGHELSAYARFSERRKLYQLQLRADRIFRTFVTYKLQAYYGNDKVVIFDGEEELGHRTVKRWGAKFGLGQQLFKLGLLEFTARYEQIRFTNPPDGPINERRIASLVGSLQYDTKDSYTFPTRGAVIDVTAEASSDILGGDEVIRKFEGSIETFQQIGRKINLHPRVGIGLSQTDLPIYDRFYLGGSRSFYGYRTDQLAGDKYLLGNLELRIGPIYSFYLSGRYDVGDVFGTLEDVRFDNLRHAIGAALSLDTPVGPISFGYGRAERKVDNLYLNLGFDF